MQGAKKRKLCPHCELSLGRTAYYEHKRKYYSATSGVWQKVMAVKPPEVECEYRTDQDEISASDLEDAECKDSDKEASDTDTENQAEHNEAVRTFVLYLYNYLTVVTFNGT